MSIGITPATAFPSGYAISAAAAGRMSLPVAPASVIYSHFEHVSGTPAPEGVRGVTINKLKILDTLIEQLAKMKQQPQPSFGVPGEDAEKRINALIEQYENQIRTAQAVQTIPYSPAPPAPLGAAFSLSA